MIEITAENTVLGATYSQSNYEDFKENKNIFEEVIDALMLDQYSDEPELTEFIKTLPGDKKRLAILSLLDKDNNMWLKLKSMLGDTNLSKVAQIKDVVLMLREYVKIAEVEKKKFGEVMTPLDLVKEMLATLPIEVWSNPDLKWLDPANGTGPFPIMVIFKLMKGLEKWQPDEELRYKHIIENMIYVCELQPKNMFLYLCAIDPKDEYNCNVYTGSFLDDSFDKHMREIWNIDSFDIVIGNPPYNQMIDMLFLSKSYNISDSILFVHPSTWLLDEKGKQKKFNNTKELVKEHLESIKLFNGNGVFGISLFVPCVISYINKYKKNSGIICFDKINSVELVYNKIEDINKFSNVDIYPILKNKLINFCKDNNLNKVIKNQVDKTYFVNLAQIRGHVKDTNKLGLDMNSAMLVEDFYTMVSRNLTVSLQKRIQREKTQVSFDTEIEANNLLKYVKTNFSRFCLSILKNNGNLYCGEYSLIPWLDFKQEWDDNKLYQYFELTKEEIEFINKHIPTYY